MLFDSGLSTLLISVYDGPKEEQFYKLCKKANFGDDQYVIRNRYMSSDKNFGLNISNRSGTLKCKLCNTTIKESSFISL